MQPIHIPIRSLMSEPEDTVEFMAMPREMSTFEMPRLPEPGADADANDVAGAHDVIEFFIGHMQRWMDDGGEVPALEDDITAWAAAWSATTTCSCRPPVCS